MAALIFDTTFLIDFQRERMSGECRNAHSFLEIHSDHGAYLSVVACGEYAEGFEDPSHPAFVSVVESFELLDVTRKTAWHYGRIARELRTSGLMIDANDLWIAATALEHDLPLVTANSRHLGRVPALQVLGY